MLEIITTKQFEKDIKLSKKRKKDLSKLWSIIAKLSSGRLFEAKHKPHKLFGNWESFTECHIEPDWLLIYQVKDKFIYLVRTGSHSDLF